jgi:hypothetical protein
MLHNLVSELNRELGLALYIDSKENVWAGNEIIELVSKNVKGLTSKDVGTVMLLCKKYDFVLIKWILDIGVIEEKFGGFHTYVTMLEGKINILMLHIRPMFKWEQEWRG